MRKIEEDQVVAAIGLVFVLGLAWLSGCGQPQVCEGTNCPKKVQPGIHECGDGYIFVGGECVEDGTSPDNPPDNPPSGPMGVVSCDTVVSYTPAVGETVGSLFIRGEFNNWDLSQPLTRNADGSFTIALTLAAGEYGYKLFDQDADRWFEDPANPYVKWVGGMHNSRLRVSDCNVPVLALDGQPTVAGGSVSFRVRYRDGAGRAGVDPSSVVVTRNDVGLVGTFDAASGTFTIRDTNLPRGKYAYRFRAADGAGHVATRLYVPVWVESTAFDWRDAVLYFAFTDRFVDGNPSNNAPTAGVDARANWQGGDFAGLQSRIDSGYFDELGVNALWLSSVVQNTSASGRGVEDGRQYSAYHSYWPVATGWREGHELQGLLPVDPHFGTLEELKALVQAAHSRGIRVIVDLVANHVHQDSPLWREHENDGWFHNLFVCGWDQPVTCWFTDYLPDLDHQNLDVMNAFVEHAVWLAQETDIDGYRLDAVKHMIHELPQTLRARLNESVATTGLPFYIVGETFVGEGDAAASLIKEYVKPQELDGQFDFPLYWQVVTTFLREERSFQSLESTLQHFQGYYGDSAIMANFLGNHDTARAVTHAAGQIADMWGNGAKELGWNNPPATPSTTEPYERLRLAWTFLLTLPGVPLIYYGDEFGMEGAGDPDNRKMMRFGGELNAFQQATLAHVKLLTATRRAHPALRTGSREQLFMDGDSLCWAYALKQGSDTVVVVLNRGGTRTRDIPVGSLGLASGKTLKDVIHGTSHTVAGSTVSVTLNNRDAAVLVVE